MPKVLLASEMAEQTKLDEGEFGEAALDTLLSLQMFNLWRNIFDEGVFIFGKM
jgi:hypothetical protein